MLRIFKINRLEKRLRTAFRKIEKEIATPSSQKLWEELQKRPEFGKLQAMEQKFAELRPKQQQGSRGYASFWRKHRYIAGLVAACLVLVVIFAKFAPPYGKTGDLIDKLLPPDKSIKEEMEINMQEDSSTSLKEIETPETSLQTYALQAGDIQPNEVGSNEAASPRAAPHTFSSSQQEKALGPKPEENFGLDEGLQMQQELGARSDIQADAAAFGKVQELLFQEETAFSQALEEISHLAAEGIWRIKHISDELSFQKGSITKTENTLLAVYQKYKNKEGHKFTLIQQFLPDANGRIAGMADRASSLDQPIQVGSYSGYLRRLQPDFHAVTWFQEQSMVTLSGGLDEEQLYAILASMEDNNAGENSD